MAMSTQHTFQVLTKRPERMREYLEAGPNRREAIIGQMHKLGAHFAAIPWPLPNVWLGVSVERQQEADERVPILLGTPAAVRWISAEPLLGPVDLRLPDDDECYCDPEAREFFGAMPVASTAASHSDLCPHSHRIDWVVVGGESGKDARPMHPDWARSLRDQCIAASVPFLFKQWGEWLPAGDWYSDHPVSLPLREWRGSSWGEVTPNCDEYMARTGKKAAGRTLDGRIWDQYPTARPLDGGGHE
jgi:protein gp37